MARTLSQEATEICHRHWRPKGAACGSCPLHAPCSTFHATLSQSSLSEWRGLVNGAAAKIAAAPEKEPSQ